MPQTQSNSFVLRMWNNAVLIILYFQYCIKVRSNKREKPFRFVLEFQDLIIMHATISANHGFVHLLFLTYRKNICKFCGFRTTIEHNLLSHKSLPVSSREQRCGFKPMQNICISSNSPTLEILSLEL